MYVPSTYRFKEIRIFDIQTLTEAVRMIVINGILAFIFLFLILEQIDWSIYSFKDTIEDNIVDNTSWNINKILKVY